MINVPDWIASKYPIYKPSLVILDYLQIIQERTRSQAGVANWTRKLVAMAAKYQITILILANTPRGGSSISSSFIGATKEAHLNLVARRGKQGTLEVSSDQRTWHTYLTDREYMTTFTPEWHQDNILSKLMTGNEQAEMELLPDAYVKELHPYLRPDPEESMTDLIIAQLHKRYSLLERSILLSKEENFKAFIEFD
jgi:hypothetical protein